jgi:predicted nucleic acid-binding Zn ribbon protein
MSKYNVTEAAVTKPEVPASKKKKIAGRTVKLKSSKWYQSAVRSIGITKESLVESRDGVFK